MIKVPRDNLVKGKRYFILRHDNKDFDSIRSHFWNNGKWSGIFQFHQTYYNNIPVTSLFNNIICYTFKKQLHWRSYAQNHDFEDKLSLTEPSYQSTLDDFRPYTFIFYEYYTKDEIIQKSINRQRKNAMIKLFSENTNLDNITIECLCDWF